MGKSHYVATNHWIWKGSNLVILSKSSSFEGDTCSHDSRKMPNDSFPFTQDNVDAMLVLIKYRKAKQPFTENSLVYSSVFEIVDD